MYLIKTQSMKNKILLTLIAIALFQTVQAQKTTIIEYNNPEMESVSDTTVIDSARNHAHADTIKFGDLMIIQCEDCSTGEKSTTSINYDSDGSDEEEKLDNVEISWFGFDIGINSYVDKSNYGSAEVNNFVRLGAGNPEATEDLFSLHGIKSVNVNIWPILLKVNLIKHIINLKTGIGIVMNNYRYSKNVTYVNDPNETYITLNKDIDLKKNKLFTEYLTIPVLLHLTTNPYHDSKSFHFSAGPTFGLLIKSRTKQKSDKRGKVKNNDPFNLETFRMGLRTEIGYGPINLYGAYSFTPIHKYGLTQYPFSIGISLVM